MHQHATKDQERTERTALRRRVRRFYKHFNRQDWQRCYDGLDPRLRNEGKVSFHPYAQSLSSFVAAYGAIDIWHIDLSLHLDAAANKRDPRPFAYAYIFWQDQRHAFHVFRERWVREAGEWYTRVAGLVTHAKSGELS
jgi:hypothetical protein